MSENPLAATEYLTIPELVDLFGLTPSKVRRLIEDRHLGAVRIDGVLRVPAEFIKDGAPLPTLRGTLLVLHDSGFDEDQAIAWLLAPNEELGERPIDALQAGKKSAVRRATQGLAF